MAMIAVGYRGSPDVLEGRVRDGELAPRGRRPLAETAFAGQWGRGLEADRTSG
jgi:hypothetical protein